jgi:hypothetical protein
MVGGKPWYKLAINNSSHGPQHESAEVTTRLGGGEDARGGAFFSSDRR